MLRLLKLAGYALVGFAVYELITGLFSDRPGEHRQREGEAEGSHGLLTGGGHGMQEITLDSHGESVPHRVGRGARPKGRF